MNKNPKLTKLRSERQKKEWSTHYVAKLLGMSQSMYSYLEIGTERLSYKVAVDIAELFNTTPDDLFYDDFKEFYKDTII